MTPTEYHLRQADWAQDLSLLRQVRHTVFVVEQQVPESLEWDQIDPACLHVLALDNAGHSIGTARLLPDGHIGRVAVLAEWRGKQVGAALMEWMIDAARARGDRHVALNAQSHAAAFYERLGFAKEGEPFEEAGIPHIAMIKAL